MSGDSASHDSSQKTYVHMHSHQSQCFTAAVLVQSVMVSTPMQVLMLQQLRAHVT